tara:strand:+ start:929 stop:1207 length:279 start_codon:yes stop_codon:yes gene_type:complete
VRFKLPRLPLPDSEDLISKIMNELTGNEFVLEIKDSVMDEVKKELKPLVTQFLEEIKRELIETASERMCSIIYESLLEGLNRRGEDERRADD